MASTVASAPGSSSSKSSSGTVPSSDDASRPPLPIPEPVQDYGRRYTALLQALDVAVRKGANKFTYADFEHAFPLLCALDSAECKGVCVETGEALRTRVHDVAQQKLVEANVGEGLHAVQVAVQNARERELSGEGSIRGDEWILTPGLSPQAISVAYNLPVYDAEYARLSKELEELNEDISTLSSSLKSSEAESAVVQNQLNDQMAAINESVAALETLDLEELTGWMEGVLGTQRAAR